MYSNKPVMQQLITVINTRWAVDWKQCPPALIPFYNNRSELVPSTLRKEMLQQIHKSHIGIEGCPVPRRTTRVRRSLEWHKDYERH